MQGFYLCLLLQDLRLMLELKQVYDESMIQEESAATNTKNQSAVSVVEEMEGNDKEETTSQPD
jgi:hypothetical protein